MATVYLAEDLKHKRKVALKVLKPELAAVLGAERFVQENTTTAALQHPHILPLFDSGTADGFLYYVMPYIQGETLRSKLDRETQLGIDDAVRIATSVADALDYAHRQGVIHRDIKPENILLHEGRPMVADFGIALAVSAAAGGRMTETGLSLGTPHYMSPEQATAEKEIGARSDVYSLASVLYEMLAGQPPHIGGSAQQIIMKIIAEPSEPVTRYRKSVPAHVAAALAKALEKLPADRFASARTFAEALGNPSFTHGTTAGHGVGLGRQSQKVWWVTAAIALITLVGGYLIGGNVRSDDDVRPVHFRVSIPDGIVSVGNCCGRSFTLSPDGHTMVFVGMTAAATGGLYRLSLDQLDAELIPGTESGASPFFSPNGEWLGFEAEGILKKLRLAGGPVVPIARSGPVSNATWTDRDQIVYAATQGRNRLWTVSAAGGQPVMIPTADTVGPGGLPYPAALPGGRAVLSSVDGGAGGLANRRIVVVDLETGGVDTIGIGTNAEYADGHLFIGGADGTLSVQPFDPARRRLTGEPTAILSGLTRGGPWQLAFAVSAGGALAYRESGSNAQAGEEAWLQLMVAPVRGVTTPRDEGSSAVDGAQALPMPTPRPTTSAPAISPDGRQVVFRVPSLNGTNRAESVGDLWLLDMLTSTVSRLTTGGALTPIWTRNGQYVTYYFIGGSGSPSGIYSRAADRSGGPELVIAGREMHPASWTPDGQVLFTQLVGEGSSMDIGIAAPGDSVPRWLLRTNAAESQPMVSTNGEWLAYTGEGQVWLRPMRGDGAPVQVSAGLGESPRWSTDGRTLYYLSLPDRAVTAATMAGATVTGRLTVSDPIAATAEGQPAAGWDLFPDGRSMLFVAPTGGGERPRLAVVQHWQAFVRAMAGTR